MKCVYLQSNSTHCESRVPMLPWHRSDSIVTLSINHASCTQKKTCQSLHQSIWVVEERLNTQNVAIKKVRYLQAARTTAEALKSFVNCLMGTYGFNTTFLKVKTIWFIYQSEYYTGEIAKIWKIHQKVRILCKIMRNLPESRKFTHSWVPCR